MKHDTCAHPGIVFFGGDLVLFLLSSYFMTFKSRRIKERFFPKSQRCFAHGGFCLGEATFTAEK